MAMGDNWYVLVRRRRAGLSVRSAVEGRRRLLLATGAGAARLGRRMVRQLRPLRIPQVVVEKLHLGKTAADS